MLESILAWLYLIIFAFLIASAFAFMRNKDLLCYTLKMTLFYASILLSSFFTCFGAVATYFYDEGCVVAMRLFHIFCSLWLDTTIEVRGRENIELASGSTQQPIVIISNHQSSLDLFVMASMWPAKCTAMMKKSLIYVPLFNIGAILSNSIFVDRTSKENGKSALNDAIGKMRRKKLKIWMFPEGTRHHEHGLLPFKKGAFNIAVCGHFPIVPVVISDYRPFYSHPKRYFRTRGHVIVQIMKPVSTEELTYNDVLALCERVHQEMAEVYEKISKESEQIMQERMTTS